MLNLTVFACGAAVMILELVGSRALAPWLGSSILVWTALIGSVLAALSLGYWLGGRVADSSIRKSPEGPAHWLARVILAAAGWTLAASQLRDPVLSWFASLDLPLGVAATLGSLVLFGLPGALLGMVSPLAVRLAVSRECTVPGAESNVGRVAGRLYALSTLGSIAGTFAAGFALIPWLGTGRLIITVAGILAFTAATTPMVWRRALPGAAALMLACAACLWLETIGRGQAEAEGVYDLDTRYSRMFIRPGSLPDSEGRLRPARMMITDPGMMQSASFTHDPSELALTYLRFYRLFEAFRPEAARFLVIGGGGFGMPKHLLANWKPTELVEAVEIDPGVTQAAREHFGLPGNDARLRVAEEDGRVWLNRESGRSRNFHVAFLDAFNSWYAVPFHLTTVEAARRISAVLDDDGVLLVNLIAPVADEGDGRADFFRGFHAAVSAVFPEVRVFLARNPNTPTATQNVILVCLKRPLSREPDEATLDPDVRIMLGFRYAGRVAPVAPGAPGAPVAPLTDDFAPVENLLLALLRR